MSEHIDNFTRWRLLALEAGADDWLSALSGSLERCRVETGDAVVSVCMLPTGTKVVEAANAGMPLAGVPFAAKDLFDVAGEVTHCSSRMPDLLAARADSDAAAVTRMRSLGAFCCVKTQMNEFAYGLSGSNPHYGDWSPSL